MIAIVIDILIFTTNLLYKQNLWYQMMNEELTVILLKCYKLTDGCLIKVVVWLSKIVAIAQNI